LLLSGIALAFTNYSASADVRQFGISDDLPINSIDRDQIRMKGFREDIGRAWKLFRE
jgi:hypothetical protein